MVTVDSQTYDAGRARNLGACLRLLGESEREGGFQVVPGVGAEGDVRLGVRDAGDLVTPPGMTSASSSCALTRTMATRSNSPVTEYTSLTCGICASSWAISGMR